MTDEKQNGRAQLLRRKKEGDLSTFLFGRIPPQCRDIEEAVIGALMLEKDAYEEVALLLQPEIFYVEAHQKIVEAIIALHQEKAAEVDILTVTEYCRRSHTLEEVGGAYFITELTMRVAGASNIAYHMHLIYQAHMQRELIRKSTDVIREMFEGDDPFDKIHDIKQFLTEIEEPVIRLKEQPLSKQIDKTIEMMEAASQRKEATLGIPTGFAEIDTTISGAIAGELNIIAARPGQGKTSFILSIANYLRKHAVQTDIYSFESMSYNVIMRMMSMDLGIPFSSIRHGNVDKKLIRDYCEDLKLSPLNIEDTTKMSCEDLVTRARARKRHYDTKIIIIDYLQLVYKRDMRKNANRENEVAEISRALKQLAMETDATVFALAQLSREVEKRGGDMMPRLSDIRESGSVEADADAVMFIYRPEYYKKYWDAEGYSTAGVAIIDVAKNRNGETRQHKLRFQGSTMAFSDFPIAWEAEYRPEYATKKKSKDMPAVRDITEPVRDEDDAPKDEELPF